MSTAPLKNKPVAGVIGLGIMGSAMAANLVKAGFNTFGYDPVVKARVQLKQAGGRSCTSVELVVKNCRLIVLSLPSVDALMQVCAEVIATKRRGLILAETSTLPEEAKVRARDLLAAHGVTLLDCPLSGTGAQALVKDLAVYASGDETAIRKFAPVFAGFARARYDVGDFGKGMRMKLVANLLVAIHNVSTAEAILMGVNAGLDAGQVVDVVADGAGGSRMFTVRGPVMVKRNWDEATMKVSTWQKDMLLINNLLRDTDTPAPLFSTCLPIYNAAMALGHGPDDTAAVYSVLEHMMGAGSKPQKSAPKKAARKAATRKPATRKPATKPKAKPRKKA